MPYRRPKNAYVLPVVTILAMTAPFGMLGLSDSPKIRSVDESNLAAIPANMAEVALASAPDLVLPLRELTGLDLPDLRLSDLRNIPLPASIKIPAGLELPGGVQLPDEIRLPRLDKPADPNAPRFIAAPGPQDPNAAPPTADGEPGSVPAPATPGAPVDENLSAPGNPAPVEAPAPDAATRPAIPGDLSRPALAPGAVPGDLVSKVGAQVKELTRDKPFSMVALTAQDMAGMTAMIRAQLPDGAWGPWYSAEPVDTPGRTRSGTEPIYVGSTKAVQILMTKKNVAAPIDPASAGSEDAAGAAPVDPAVADEVPVDPAAPVEAAAPEGEAAPLAPAEPAPFADHGDPAQIDLEKLAAILIDPGRGAADENLNEVAAALPGGGPKVITRSQWGADEDLRCEEPTYDDGLAAITVHHTAGRNDYSRSESAGIVRAIYSYHAKTLGWCDIGYNALVDKYGQIFEGRFGGLDRPVEGAHSGGFNINTAGVALMGNYEEDTPSEVSMQAMGKFIGWRARVAGIDPEGTTTMYSEGSDYTRYALGQAVKLPTIFAHRDVGNTSCPGDAVYDRMDRIREIAEKFAGPSPLADPPSTTKPPTPRSPAEQNANYQPQPAPSAEDDIATLAELTTTLLGLIDTNPVAKYWNEQGGPNSALGQPKSAPQPTMDGGQYARFVNGYVYSTPKGQVYALLGKILERFVQLGGATGILGLPTSNEYAVKDGVRTDFQFGSLIFNRLTGIVTTILQHWGAVQDPAPSVNPGRASELPAVAPIPDASGQQPAVAAIPDTSGQPAVAEIPRVMPGIPAQQ
ncbi:N-acetylmuramoyl-L-alanine amidase [Nocardia sp. NPDC055321]